MTVPPYNQGTCYPLSSFEAPHEPWYGQPMFKPCSAWLRWLWLGCLVTLCQAYYPQPMTMPSFYANVYVLLCIMDDMTFIKYGHRTTLWEHPMKVAEPVIKS